MRDSRAGISLVEIIIVITMVGLMAGIMVPRFRMSPKQKLRAAAQVVAYDLELARTRALSTRSLVRVTFDATNRQYAGYLDHDRNGALAQNSAEQDALSAFRTKTLDAGVSYDRGAAGDVPTFAGAGNITFASTRIEFDPRGLTNPFGSKGVVYLRHADDAAAVSAVTVSAGGGIKIWRYEGGAWQ